MSVLRERLMNVSLNFYRNRQHSDGQKVVNRKPTTSRYRKLSTLRRTTHQATCHNRRQSNGDLDFNTGKVLTHVKVLSHKLVKGGTGQGPDLRDLGSTVSQQRGTQLSTLLYLLLKQELWELEYNGSLRGKYMSHYFIALCGVHQLE
jgi:hypothetical protein